MPKNNSKFLKPDPFIMNEDTVNYSVFNYLRQKGFCELKCLTGKKHGIDVEGKKNEWTIWVESKGSTGNDASGDMVFDSGQIKTHADRQIMKLMEYLNVVDENVLLVLANPDIPRIRGRIAKIDKILDQIGLIQFWVQEDQTVQIEYPEQLQSVLVDLEIM
ncbi:hypothetical protein [Alkalihalobacillus sp. 1P02AB]|uniref:hypothetical protein n=1 Tax=Alkalihalobacillus sp. 1P02AB TaxID=3132260 RepID=UPI0039A51E33